MITIDLMKTGRYLISVDNQPQLIVTQTELDAMEARARVSILDVLKGHAEMLRTETRDLKADA